VPYNALHIYVTFFSTLSGILFYLQVDWRACVKYKILKGFSVITYDG
jgi:hypothetical protein